MLPNWSIWVLSSDHRPQVCRLCWHCFKSVPQGASDLGIASWAFIATNCHIPITHSTFVLSNSVDWHHGLCCVPVFVHSLTMCNKLGSIEGHHLVTSVRGKCRTLWGECEQAALNCCIDFTSELSDHSTQAVACSYTRFVTLLSAKMFRETVTIAENSLSIMEWYHNVPAIPFNMNNPLTDDTAIWDINFNYLVCDLIVKP